MDAVTPGRDSRAQIAELLANSPEPMTVDAISEHTGLHANTVRSHLEVLLAKEVATREATEHAGRGRPRWVYQSAAQVASPYQILASALSMQLAQIKDPLAAKGAAELWVESLPALPIATSPDEAVAEAAGALNRLGFTAEATALGDAIHVSGCPYADIVEANPVICEIHTAMLSTLLANTGQPIAVTSMEVWSRPGMCTARLHRTDQKPSRIITPEEIQP
jgi:predicted ArsR family transcriptional regulator